MVSLIKFDGKQAEELERIPVGMMKTEIEGPHGLTVDPTGEYWYLSSWEPLWFTCQILN